MQRDHAEASDALEEKFEHAKGRAATLEAEKTALLEKMGQLEEDARKEVDVSDAECQATWVESTVVEMGVQVDAKMPATCCKEVQTAEGIIIMESEKEDLRQQEVQELREKFEKASETVKMTQLTEKLEEEVAQAKQSTATAEEENEKLSLELSVLREHKSTANEELQGLQQSLAAKDAQIASLSAEGDTAKARISELEAQLAEANAKVETFCGAEDRQGEVDMLQKTNIALTEELRLTQRHVEEITAKSEKRIAKT